MEISDNVDDSEIEEVPPDPNEVITVEYVRNKKIAEMNTICSKAIQDGFDVKLSDDASHHFSLTEQDQLNLITLSTMIASDGEPCIFYPVEDITAILNAATSWKTYHVTYNNSLKMYINALDNISDISAITYGIEIPVDYQSDVLRVLLMQE